MSSTQAGAASPARSQGDKNGVMDGSLTIGRILGIPVAVHHTWLIALFLVTWSLASGFFPAAYPGWEPTTYWVAGVVAALLLFVSVLLHEISHAVVARSRGLPVRGITLFIFGGVAAIGAEAEEPKDEFLIAIVGPITSFLIAGLAWLALGAVGDTTGVAHATLAYLAIANALLGGFNLIPGFPLDGGRVLRAIVWAATGNLRTATNAASYVGQAVAFALIAWGIYRVFNGDFMGGLWTAFIGWFLNGAAESSRRQLAVQARFAGVRVADLMTPEAPTVPPTMTLDAFVYDEVIRRGHRAMAVVDASGLLGIVSVADAQRAPVESWPTTPVSAVMTRDELAVVGPGDDLNRGLELMQERGLHQLLVVDGGRLVGMLTRAGVIQYLVLREQIGIPPRRAGVRARPEPDLRQAA